MRITYVNDQDINTLILPDKKLGQFSATNASGSNIIFNIDGEDDAWVLRTKGDVRIVVGKEFESKMRIENYGLFLLDTGEDCLSYVLIEPLSADRQTFRKYVVSEGADLQIGRSSDSDIILNNNYVSNNHLQLSFVNDVWHLTDQNSSNGTFVNGVKATNRTLSYGDRITILSFEFVVGMGLIALNNPDGAVSMNTNQMSDFISQPSLEQGEYELDEQSYFYRSPRFKRDIDVKTFAIDSPPGVDKEDDTSALVTMGPSLTMGLASATTGLFTVNNALSTGNVKQAIPSIVMSVSMLLGTIMWPSISRKSTKKKKRVKEVERNLKYREYLRKMEIEFVEECQNQEEILRENFIHPTECVQRAISVNRNLWERSSRQNDFMHLRLGLGNLEMRGDVQFSGEKFTVDQDPLELELFALGNSDKSLVDVPVAFDFYANMISGVVGDKAGRIELALSLIAQISSYYSYDEVKLLFIYDEEFESELDFVRRLPHLWNDDRNMRFLVNSISDGKNVSSYLEQEFERLKSVKTEDMDTQNYFVIFAFNPTMAVRLNALSKVYESKYNMNVSIIHFYPELKDLPKECSAVIEVNQEAGRVYDREDISGSFIDFKRDQLDHNYVDQMSQSLANISLDLSLAGHVNIPTMITFLDMYNAGKVEHLNILTRWAENDPTQTLEAPVGLDAMGEIFMLDLHEKFHGPHGLVAGMTGSGKSEFIISYILSLAINYHPNEVAFILIDYKGGGMAKAFENLPHVAGIITNLDGAAVNRSLVSIQSELKRRQAIFSEASKKVGESNIDIYTYQKLYRDGSVLEPLQHLFIISDEFAELKTQQPEFMEQLISAARIGRSLGIHLILATQKPAGVVDDQIWSNSKFRVCLKVQEKADSQDMLKRPDAAELTITGRFYLQVGYNELFEIGQSAWAGAPYYPSEEVEESIDKSISVLNNTGQVIKQVRPQVKRGLNPNPNKQLDEITNYINRLAINEKIKIRPLWLEPIKEKIYYDDLKAKYSDITNTKYILNPLIGELDDPSTQSQLAFRMPISEGGNIALYGTAGSGRTTFLNTLIYSLITEHSPKEVNLYLLDFASETMNSFKNAPHVADVVLSSETEKLRNLLKVLTKEVTRRKNTFMEFGGDYASYTNEDRNDYPQIVVIINNYEAFSEMFDDIEDQMINLTRDGSKYGIYFIVTTTGLTSIRYRLIQNFKQTLTLQLSDEGDYSSIVGRTEGLYPEKFRGRGLIKRDKLMEFQVALIDEKFDFSFVRELSEELLSKYSDMSAQSIPVLPKIVDRENLINKYKNNEIVPVGINTNSLNVEYMNLSENYIYRIMSLGNEERIFVSELAKLVEGKFDNYYLFDLSKTVDLIDEVNVCNSSSEASLLIEKIFEETVSRNNQTKKLVKSGGIAPKFNSMLVIIIQYTQLINGLSDELVEKLELILEKGSLEYNMKIVVSDSAGDFSKHSYKKWYKNHINPGNGIWIGSGITDQFILNPTKQTREMHSELSHSFGYILNSGKANKIKVLSKEEIEL